MSASVPIAIIGAGISGLTLAHALLRHGIPSTIYKKSPPPTTTTTTTRRRHNYGITLSVDSCASLSAVLSDIAPNPRHYISVDHDVQGHHHHVPPASQGPSSLRAAPLRAHRGRLESLLATGLDVRWRHELSSVEPGWSSSGSSSSSSSSQAVPSTKLRFKNGHETTASLVVGADGVHSALRALLLPQLKPGVLPYVVFRGQRRVDGADFGQYFTPALRERGNGVVQLRREGVVMIVAVDDRDGGADVFLVSWLYSRRARPSGDVLYRPERGVHQASVVPDEFYAEVSGIQGLEEPFRYIFDVGMMRRDRIQNFLMRQLLSDGEAFRELANHGIAFLGDAAHAIPIVGSEGADYAIQDALDLANMLDGYDIGAFTKEMPSVEFEHTEAVDHPRLRAIILQFYEAKISDRGGASSWKALVESAETLLATMHNR